jgi:selenocysteine lyase/cysteine desulfurase
VVDAVSHYFVSSYAQLGAGYPLSNRATSTVDEAHKFVRDILFNGYGVQGTAHAVANILHKRKG